MKENGSSMYDHRDPGYEKSLRAICNEFLETVGDKPIDRVTDEDLKAYEKRIAPLRSRGGEPRRRS